MKRWLCLSLFGCLATVAQAATSHYTIKFTATSGTAPTSGSFTYDDSGSGNFTNFTISDGEYTFGTVNLLGNSASCALNVLKGNGNCAHDSLQVRTWQVVNGTSIGFFGRQQDLNISGTNKLPPGKGTFTIKLLAHYTIKFTATSGTAPTSGSFTYDDSGSGNFTNFAISDGEYTFGTVNLLGNSASCALNVLKGNGNCAHDSLQVGTWQVVNGTSIGFFGRQQDLNISGTNKLPPGKGTFTITP